MDLRRSDANAAIISLHIRQYEVLGLVFTVGWRKKENSGHRMRRRVRYMMDQQKIWEDNLKKNTAIENAIAVAGLKAALLVGKHSFHFHCHTNLLLRNAFS
jgi:hypothetical protein